MPNSNQANKRVRQNEKAREHNRAIKSNMKTHIKRVESAIDDKAADVAQTEFVLAAQKIDKAAQKNIIHRNNAARKKSRLAQKINALSK
ncbi:30S ribosomal protein S20 [bacterium AH-315-F18]|nr:30S ribosomal protein S20 [bacterium AH-315-F18]